MARLKARLSNPEENPRPIIPTTSSHFSSTPIDIIDSPPTLPPIQANIQVVNGPAYQNSIVSSTHTNNSLSYAHVHNSALATNQGFNLASVILNNSNPRLQNNPNSQSSNSIQSLPQNVVYRSRYNTIPPNNTINNNTINQSRDMAPNLTRSINRGHQFHRTIIRIQPADSNLTPSTNNNTNNNNSTINAIPIAATVQSMYAINDSWHPILPTIIHTGTIGSEETIVSNPQHLSTFVRTGSSASHDCVQNPTNSLSSNAIPTTANDLGYATVFPHASIWRKKKKHNKPPTNVLGELDSFSQLCSHS